MGQISIEVAVAVLIAVVTAGVFFAYKIIRDEILKRHIEDAFSAKTAGTSIGGFEIGFTNTSSAPVTVRQVKVYFDYPERSVELKFTELAPFQFSGDRGLKTGEGGLMEISEYRDMAAEPSPEGFLTLSPGVGGKWRMPKLPPAKPENRTIKVIRAIIEYPRVIGGHREMAVDAKSNLVQWINEWYQHYLEGLDR